LAASFKGVFVFVLDAFAFLSRGGVAEGGAKEEDAMVVMMF
jgi:hypothetical protein